MYKKFTDKKVGVLELYTHKILRIMRLTTVILIASMLQVSAFSFAQKVTLKQKSISLSTVFREIEKQTGYSVIYYAQTLNTKSLIDVNFAGASLDLVMTKVLSGLPYTFTYNKNYVIIKDKEKSILDKVMNIFSAANVKGKIVDESGNPLIGATIKLKGTIKYVQSDKDGNFFFPDLPPNAVLQITYVGYGLREIQVVDDKFLTITLSSSSENLDSVSIVSTGFQQLPKERATGSFVQVDNSLINRSVSTNILDRLNGVTSGLIFSSDALKSVGQGSIEIHGRSTLFAGAEPLIILDNFPYEGNLSNINPNDIESVTVLKDAAAASAWGTRSGNGVIVITTKKGSLNSAPKVSFNANVNIGQKPDLYYSPWLGSKDFIEVQKFLYDKGAYTNDINNGYSILPPAVEIFRNPTDPNYQAKLDQLGSYDLRDQLSKYFYRHSINQQYQTSISGGNTSQKYFVSAGYDKNMGSAVGSDYNRITLNASNTYYFLKNKLAFFSNIVYTSSKNESARSFTFSNPYDQVADANGNAIAVANTLRLSYAQTAGGGKLLDWMYKPLDELNNGYNTPVTNLTDYRINTSLTYTILPGLKASALYNFEKGISDRNTLYELESFYTRNLINRYTQINTTTGAVTYPLPMGDIFTNELSTIKNNNGRFQVDYDHQWGKHSFSGIAGTEIRETNISENHYQFLGYNRETGTNQNAAVNYTADNKYFYNTSTDRISPNTGASGIVNRYFSYYFNGSYTYDGKYIASVSAREDESNLFGVATNQKGVPLWSAGLSWIINKEKFYSSNVIPQLKLRATFGYTGNVDNSLSALLTAQTASSNINNYNALYSVIVNPPNPSLRWEKIQNINFGLDFSTKGNWLTGSVDVWQKKGIDLIGNSPIAPQTGIVLYTGNSANTLTKGYDVQLNSINLRGAIKWYTTLLYNHSTSKVTNYKVSNGTNFNVISANYNNPLQGYPYFSIFSFKYGGLNSSGNPQGYLNGDLSTNYSAINNSTNRNELVYNGSATPTHFGALRNTFIYKNLDFSFNISYRLGYFFRRTSLNNTSLYSTSTSYAVADYDKRWQKAGDEAITNVPALIYPAIAQRDAIYTYSDFLVEKGDNIRLQDIRLGYTFPKRLSSPFKNLNLFTFINNAGILWRANKYHLDPDYPTGIPVIRTIAFGLRTDL